jgi:Predicted NTP pyrophosphohydrolase
VSAHSAGLLLWRDGGAEVWIGHMGGPYWSRKEERAWSIPKGLVEPGEKLLAVALREFEEEIGTPPPARDYALLGEYRYTSGKLLTVFHGDGTGFDVAEVRSNTFQLEWPPRSGRMRAFPELDRAAWVPVARARELLIGSQAPMLDDLPVG